MSLGHPMMARVSYIHIRDFLENLTGGNMIPIMIGEPGWTAEAGTGMHQHAPITYPSHHSMA